MGRLAPPRLSNRLDYFASFCSPLENGLIRTIFQFFPPKEYRIGISIGMEFIERDADMPQHICV